MTTFLGTVAGVPCKFLLDTGSSINVLNKSVFDVLPRVTLLKTATKARTAGQEELPLLGLVKLTVKIADQSHVVSFYVTDSIDVPCLLGLDFLRVVPCVIDLSSKRLILTERDHVRSVSAEKTECVGRAVLGSDFSLPPAAGCFVKGFAHNRDYAGPVLVEPCLAIPGVEVVRCIATVTDSVVPQLIRNVTAENVSLPKHSQIADLEVSYEELLPESGSDGSRSVDIESTVDLSDTDLTDSQRSALFTVLKKHSTMFDGHVGHATLITHQIDTGDHSPICQAPRRIPPHLKEQVREQLDQLVKDGVLEQADGSWASPICLVKKKSGEIRICADMRKLNACTRLPAFPIPRIDDTLDALTGS